MMFWRSNFRACFVMACCALMAELTVAARAGPSSAPPPPVEAATCPQVRATLNATIDTKHVAAGDRFAFSTLEPVAVDGVTIPAGTSGTGLISTLDHSKSEGHSGYLVLEARYLETAGGTHVPAAFLPGRDGHSESFVRAGSSDAGALGYLPFFIGTAAGVYNAFHHGKDAAVVAGTSFGLLVGDGFFSGSCRLAIDRH